jgi:hypothetical protein
MADTIIKPDFTGISYYKQTQHYWIVRNFDKLGLGDPKNVGYMINFLNKKKPANLVDFWWAWIKSPLNQRRFLDVLDIINEARPNVNRETNINTLFIGLFYNSFLGYIAEEQCLKYITEKFPKLTAFKTNKKIDKKYAVDLMLINPEKEFLGVQVKSIHSRVENVTNYVKRNDRKIQRFEKDFNIPVMYAYYTNKYNSVTKSFDILEIILE